MANTIQTDEITAARKKARRKQRRLRRLRTAGGILLLLVLVYSVIAAFSSSMAYDISDGFRSVFRMGKYPCRLEGGDFVSCAAGRRCLAVLTDRRLTVLKAGGAQLLDAAHGMANPSMAARSNRILVYSAGGKSYQIYNRSYRLDAAVSEQSILGGDVSARGKILLLTLDDEYSCELKVFNSDCEPRFSWFGSEGFPMAVFASDTSEKAAVVCLRAEGGRMISVVTVLDLRGNKQLTSFRTEGIASRVLIQGDRILCVLEDRAEAFDSEGKETAEYAYGDLGLLDVSSYGNGGFVLALGDNTRSQLNKVVILSGKLAETAVIPVGSRIDGLYVNSDRLSILTGSEVRSYTSSGGFRGVFPAEEDVSAVIDLGGPIAVGPESVYKLRMRKGE